MRKIYTVLFSLLLLLVMLWNTSIMFAATHSTPSTFWTFQSIDTMKFSRDIAREKENDLTYNVEIQAQVKRIKEAGATHIAIGTPYDAEFTPFMKRWVDAARANGLKVWFRGNLSGWEEWFEYPAIDRKEHTEGIRQFILANPDLFEDGDVFTSCPECENGGPGDPRQNGDVEEYRTFLINEYAVVKQSFKEINKDVKANYYSMNGDVAKLVMDKPTTKALDGIITIDHYVETVDQLVKDINEYAESSGGRVVLGEWGAPIPDIHGDMSQEEQAQWIDDALLKIVNETDIEGLNYWTHQGSSTALWDNDDTPRMAVTTISKYFNPRRVSGEIKDTKGNIINNVQVTTPNKELLITHGKYAIPLLDAEEITFTKEGYKEITIKPVIRGTENITQNIVLVKSDHTFWQKIMDYFYILFHGNGLVYATMNG